MNSTAMLLEVKRFGVHDGPGVRTVFFLKGCPLKCRWCHNPESISSQAQLAYYEHKCIQCGECIPVCPVKAHGVINGKHFFERDKCISCGVCEDVCLGSSLKLFGQKVSVEEAMEFALEDKDFFETNGGITISGGEPLLQAEFCAELFKLLNKESMHCAIDTCGAVNWSSFESVLPYTDLFLYDLKHVDDKLHQEYTGSSNRKILANLSRLSELQVPIEIRIPLVPGFNDDNVSIDAIGEFLSKLSGIRTVKVLAYHDLARSKYTALNIPYTMPQVSIPASDKLSEVTVRLANYGVKVIN